MKLIEKSFMRLVRKLSWHVLTSQDYCQYELLGTSQFKQHFWNGSGDLLYHNHLKR